MAGWWLLGDDNKYHNSATGNAKNADTFRLKNGFVANNVRSLVVRKEETRRNINGATVRSYGNVYGGMFSRPVVAIKSLAQRTVNAFAANVKMLFTTVAGDSIWVSTGYLSLDDKSLTAGIMGLISKYGWAMPTYVNINIIGGA